MGFHAACRYVPVAKMNLFPDSIQKFPEKTDIQVAHRAYAMPWLKTTVRLHDVL